jgi:hypothetical protein
MSTDAKPPAKGGGSPLRFDKLCYYKWTNKTWNIFDLKLDSFKACQVRGPAKNKFSAVKTASGATAYVIRLAEQNGN